MLVGFYKSKLVLLTETLLLTILPLGLLKFFPGWLIYRHWAMAAGLIYVYLFFKSAEINITDLGYKPKNIRFGLIDNLAFALRALFVVFGLYLILPTRTVFPIGVEGLLTSSNIWLNAVNYILVSVPLQEIIYRSYLINRAERVLPQSFIKPYAALIFMLIHIPFTTPVMTLGTLLLGWYWAGSFIKHRNIYAIYLSHILVGLGYFATMYFRP